MGLPSERLDIYGPVTPDTLGRWQTACVGAHLADSIALPLGVSAFTGTLQQWRIDDLLLVDMKADPFVSRHDRGSINADYIGFTVQSPDHLERVVFTDQQQLSNTAEMALWDNAEIVETESLRHFAATSLLIPRRLLQEARAGRFTSDSVIFIPQSPTMRILARTIAGLRTEAAELEEVGAVAVRNALLELLSAVGHIDAPISSAAVSERMRVNVIRWVDEQLSLGKVSPAEAAAHHGISVRSLHRLFAGSGDTFGSLVRRRRLECARSDLLRTADTVATTAFRWGYSDASHFIREFRRVHGATPQEYREAYRPAAHAG